MAKKDERTKMKVKLLHATQLWLCANAIRMSHDNHHLSDSYMINKDNATCRKCGSKSLKETIYPNFIMCDTCKEIYEKNHHIGKKDFELIIRVGNKLKHKSVLEQVVLFWEIDGISRACLQELVRHRTARLTVKSTRYTLKGLRNEKPFLPNEDGLNRAKKYIVLHNVLAKGQIEQLDIVRRYLLAGLANDTVKMCLPESFKTKLQWQIDMRNFQNFLELRLAKDAHWEIRKLAYELYSSLPDGYKTIAKTDEVEKLLKDFNENNRKAD